ncbi:hypothetical protein GCM10009529_30040 [Micropruina glycogenica]
MTMQSTEPAGMPARTWSALPQYKVTKPSAKNTPSEGVLTRSVPGESCIVMVLHTPAS